MISTNHRNLQSQIIYVICKRPLIRFSFQTSNVTRLWNQINSSFCRKLGLKFKCWSLNHVTIKLSNTFSQYLQCLIKLWKSLDGLSGIQTWGQRIECVDEFNGLFLLVNQNVFKWAKTDLFLFIFVLFSHHKDKYSTELTINDKSADGVLGVKPRAAWWNVETNPLSYGGTLQQKCYFSHCTI